MARRNACLACPYVVPHFPAERTRGDYRIKWYKLDLTRTEDRAAQIACIKHWGRASVMVSLDGRIALN